MTTIIVTHEDNEVDEFEFASDLQSISIGRRSSNDVCVPNLSVSGKHASIVLDADTAWLEDLGSTNGTYVNGIQIDRQQIHENDEIILGKVRLSYLGSAYDLKPADEPIANETTQTSPEHAEVNTKPETHSSGSTENQANPAESSEQDEKTTLVSPPIAVAERAVADTADSAEEKASFAKDASLFDSEASTGNGAAQKAVTAADAPHPLDGVERQDSTVAPMHELDSPSVASKGAVIEIKNGAKSGQILPIDKPVTTLGRPGIQIAAIMRKPDGYFLMHIESDDSVDRPTLNQDTIGDEPVLLHSGDELNVAGIDVEFMLS
ncbi:MAG: FHA domain-containing protein [Granulosicoccus sp.]